MIEAYTDWIAVVAYVVSSVALVIGSAFKRETAMRAGWWAAVAGSAAQLVSIAGRWIRVGHGPYLGFYEVASLLAFLLALSFIALSARWRGFHLAGAIAMPVALLILGGSMLTSRETMEVTGSLASVWLIVHVTFANLAFGAYGISFVLAIAYLLKGRPVWSALARLGEKLPDEDTFTQLSYRFVGAGFVFQTVMIASGAIWAQRAWGRYWGWDPIEVWSLIAWAVYALYLHLTLTMGWKGRRAAWIAIIALPVILFSLLGVPLVYNSIHGAYLAV